MRIWDLKHGTSLHVLKGKEEVYHLGYSLGGKRPLLVGSNLCLGGEEASSEGRRKPGSLALGFSVPTGGCCLLGCWQSQAGWKLQDGVFQGSLGLCGEDT